MAVLLLLTALGCPPRGPEVPDPGEPVAWRTSEPLAPSAGLGGDPAGSGSVPRRGGWVDLTGDAFPEVVVESDLVAPEGAAIGRMVSVWSVAGGARRVLYEDTLVWSGSGQEVRIGQVRLSPRRVSRVGVDYLLPSRCRAFSLPGPDTSDRRCLERREEVWVWSDERDAWVLLRRIDGERVRAVPSRPAGLRSAPSSAGVVLREARPGEDLLVSEVRHWEGDATSPEPPWFQVLAADGTEGWLAAPDLRFADPFLDAMVQGPRDTYPWVRWGSGGQR